VKLTKRERNLLIGLGLILFLGLYVNFGVLPLYKMVVEQTVEKEFVAENLDKAKNAVATESQLDKDIEDNKVKAGEYLKRYFASATQEELLLTINEFTKVEPVVENLTFTDYQKINRGNMDFTAMGATVSTKGTYAATAKLMNAVWNFQKHVAIDNISFTRVDAANVTSDIDLSFYWLPNAPDHNDSLVQWIPNETFLKADPFSNMEGDPAWINHIFIGGDEARLQDIFNKPFSDVAGHWAEKEIEAFRKSGYLIADAQNLFKPNDPMSRGEFLIMLDKIYKWPAPEGSVDLTKYTDYTSLGNYEGPIAKAISKGYLGGYVIGFTDNTLRPRDPITYEDMAYVMSKIKNDAKFTWKPVAEKLLAEKAFTSPGTANPKLPMSRAEVVFLMTYFK